MRPVRFAYVLALLALLPAFCWAQSQDERSVRAAFVFNLTKSIEWPPGTNQLVIGFFGNRATGETLVKMLDGKTSQSRPIQVLLFPSDDELQNCNIVYIADSRAKTLSILEKLGHKNDIVTVGETSSFAHDGGMIGLVQSGDHIQMQVNPDSAQRGGVKLGAGLLSLASIVSSGTEPAPESGDRRILRRREPIYPELAARMSLHGTVRLKAWISADGTVRRAECIGGHPVLCDSAAAACLTWKFHAGPRESSQIIELSF
jgi:TonB family protein